MTITHLVTSIESVRKVEINCIILNVTYDFPVAAWWRAGRRKQRAKHILPQDRSCLEQHIYQGSSSPLCLAHLFPGTQHLFPGTKLMFLEIR